MRQSPVFMTLCAAGIILGLLGFVFGAWRPYRKAQLFIVAEHKSGSIRTIEELESLFNTAFDYYSPVGTEEAVKFLSGNFLNIVPQQSEPVARELVAYIEPKLFKDEVRHLLMAGQFRQILWQQHGAEEDYAKSLEYFSMARAIGPNLPTPLYSLYGMYKLRGDKANQIQMGEEILKRWPQDKKISGEIAALK